MENEKPGGMEILDEPNAIGLLNFINKRGEIRSVELREVSGNYDRLKLLTQRMKDMGLLEIEVKDKPRLTYTYRLTKKGKLIADKITEIEEIIKKR